MGIRKIYHYFEVEDEKDSKDTCDLPLCIVGSIKGGWWGQYHTDIVLQGKKAFKL